MFINDSFYHFFIIQIPSVIFFRIICLFMVFFALYFVKLALSSHFLLNSVFFHVSYLQLYYLLPFTQLSFDSSIDNDLRSSTQSHFTLQIILKEPVISFFELIIFIFFFKGTLSKCNGQILKSVFSLSVDRICFGLASWLCSLVDMARDDLTMA